MDETSFFDSLSVRFKPWYHFGALNPESESSGSQPVYPKLFPRGRHSSKKNFFEIKISRPTSWDSLSVLSWLLSVFIHNGRSENGRKTTASAPAVCWRISVVTLTFIAGFPQTDFNTKLVNFFLKLVLPVILKELQSNFLISTLRLFRKLSQK